MRNFRLTLAYDGSRYKGWQKQGNTPNTIQAKLEALLSRLLGQDVEVNGSGRTDAGAHARMQVASFRAETEISADELCGKTIVVYEEIKADGKSIAEHKDPEAKEQSIYFPEIGTKALDENSKTQEGEAKEKQKIIDQITYKNLLPDETYVLKGVLIDKETGKELLDENGKRVTAGISFVPENEEGTIEMTFELDARRLAGKSVVVFERLYDEEEHLIAKEEDIENADQTVLYRKQEIPKNTIVEKPGHNSKEVRKSPKTGDENRMDLWLVMLCVFGIAVVTEIVIYKRRNR